MVVASDLKRGMVLREQGHFWQVVSVDFHQGAGKMGGQQHIRQRDLNTGAVVERRYRPEEKLEEVEVERQRLEFLYQDGEFFVFMNPETYEQFSVHTEQLIDRVPYLKESLQVTCLFFEANPITVEFPEFVDFRVVTSPPPRHDQETSTFKSVTLENGMEILAPQFIKEGDTVRVSTETGKYMERV